MSDAPAPGQALQSRAGTLPHDALRHALILGAWTRGPLVQQAGRQCSQAKAQEPRWRGTRARVARSGTRTPGTPQWYPGRCPGVLLMAWLVISMAASAGSARAAEPPTAPMLRLETGMHTAMIRRIGIDAANRYLVTGSEDKTVRVWELVTGRLLRTLRPPIDVGNEGRIDAVALSPDGRTVAAAGWTFYALDEVCIDLFDRGRCTSYAVGSNSIYLFDRESGRLLRRLTDLPGVIAHLAYSRDGAFLVATLGGANGMRLYRTQDYTQVAGDTAYSDGSYGADFDAAGRLVTASYDGFVRLYDRNGKLRTKRNAPEGARPHGVAFSPDGTRVAVGYDDSTRVDVLSGKDLTPLYAPNTSGVENGNLASVSWSADGRWLYAGGEYNTLLSFHIRRWAESGRGAFQDLPAAQNTIMYILPLAQGGVVFGAADPAFGVLDATGQRRFLQKPTSADFRAFLGDFRLARDGASVQFSYEPWDTIQLLRPYTLRHRAFVQFGYYSFALRDCSLTLALVADQALTAPVTTTSGLNITDWKNTEAISGKDFTVIE